MGDTSPVTYFNRYTRRIEREKIMGERSLRWIYGTCSGQVALHVLVKRGFFSRLLGFWESLPLSARKIPSFIREYDINMDEAECPPEGFRCFNDFFTRALKPTARPVCPAGQIAFPADARHRGWQDAADIREVYVKGQRFDLPALLGSAHLAERYEHGTLLLSRLCPVDYHRFHFPVAGTPEAAVRLPGPLASVAPYSLRRNLAWLWTNRRELTLLHTADVGEVAILAVGATGVGAIHQTYTPNLPVHKGAEQGFFCFGGSTIICLFEPGRIQLADDLVEQTLCGRELYAHVGDHAGQSLERMR